MAIDPQNPNRVYILAGISYFNNGNTAILKSPIPVALPVKWGYFYGYAKESKSLIQWQTLEEQNMAIKKLQEKDNEIEILRKQESLNKDAITNLSDQINTLVNEINQMKSFR